MMARMMSWRDALGQLAVDHRAHVLRLVWISVWVGEHVLDLRGAMP